MRTIPIMFVVVALLFIVGCGTQVDGVEQTDVVSLPEPPSHIGGYVNTAYGYQLDPLEEMEVWELTGEQAATKAGETATTIFIIEEEDNLFTVRGIDDARSSHEWLSQEVSFFYPSGDAAQRVGELDGEDAIFLRGTGAADSPARLIVAQHGSQLVVISHDHDNERFDLLLETFEFID
ncbi:MAG: hypothetical protein HQ488_02330 [Parcubacteria group bacterium]|nr:hypothetical protein [Parcubacteria group bacterium]